MKKETAKMNKTKLENINSHLKEELKNEQFKIVYEQERAKVLLAQKIAEMRQKEKLTQSQLARMLNVSQQFISLIETAQEKNLTLNTLTNVARFLDRDVEISFPKSDGIPKLKIA